MTLVRYHFDRDPRAGRHGDVHTGAPAHGPAHGTTAGSPAGFVPGCLSAFNSVLSPGTMSGRRSGVLPCCVLLALLGTAAVARGQTSRSPADEPPPLKTLSLEELAKVEVVHGASKRDQRVAEAPASVSILTRDDIREYGYRTVSELLKSVRGVYVTSDDAYPYTGLRGINRPGDFGGRVLVTIDGHRINEPIYDSSFVGTEFPLDVDLIERVEIIRGAGSSLFGNNAFFAVINIITRRAAEMNGVEVAGAGSSFNTAAGRYTYGRRFSSGTGVILSASALGSDGRERIFYPEMSAINNGVAEHLDGQHNRTIFGSVGHGGLRVQGAFANRHRSVANAPFGSVFNDPRLEYLDERGYLAATLTRAPSADTSLRIGVSYDHYLFAGTYPFELGPAPAPTILNRDRAGAESLGGHVQYNRTLRKQHKVTLGSDLRADLRLTLVNRDDDATVAYVNSRRSARLIGLFVQDEYAIRANLLINAGIRYDHFTTFGSTFNPRAAVIYGPGPGKTLKVIYGQAFRAPNGYELYYVAPTYHANAALRPEDVHSTEVIYEQAIAKHLRLTSTAFLSSVDELIGLCRDATNGQYMFDNMANVTSSGVEGELEGQWESGVRGQVSYAVARARDIATRDVLSNSPRHLGKGRVSVPLWRDRLTVGAEVQAMSSRRTVDGESSSGFWLANLTVSGMRLARRFDVSGSVYNLFDRQYGDPMSDEFVQRVLQQPGRTFRIKVTYGR
jgi:outer membrane receptor for ferrienterochelin and colicins